MSRGGPPTHPRAAGPLPFACVVTGLLWGLLCLLVAPPAVAQEQRHQGRTLPEWSADLAHPDTLTRRRAASAMAAFGASAVPVLVRPVTADADPEVRLDAIRALIRLGPAARPAVPALAAAMKDRVTFVRRGAAIALGGITPPGPAAIEALLAGLVDPDAVVVDNSAHGLMGLGNAAAGPLSRALTSPDVGLRQMAVLTLSGGIRFGKFRPVEAETVAALIGTLGDSNLDIRDEAARALADVGPQAKVALPALEKMASGDPEGSARVTARRAIERIEAR